MGKKKPKKQSLVRKKRQQPLDSAAQPQLEVLNRYIAQLQDDYQPKFDELENLYKDSQRMPARIKLTEAGNLAYDKYRIEYILKACDFLLKYFATGKSPLKIPFTTPDEMLILEGLNLLNARRLLEHIAVTIFNISGSVRAKYKALLSPVPFTWETFEHLGGLMKIAKEWKRILVRGIEREIVERFLDEYLALETTIEAAVPTIIDEDINKLKLLFSFIQKTEANQIPENFKLKPVELIAIKAFTRRVVDLESLVQLLKLSDNHTTEFDHRDAIDQIKKHGKKDTAYHVQFEDNDPRFAREIILDTKLARHAALRRIELIGELITGKYLSSFITNLDPSIDWSALNVIRDVIAHQDEKDHRLKVQALLDDPGLFQQVLGHDMQELFAKLIQVVRLRDAELPKFDNNPDHFWQTVYHFEQQKFAEQIAAQNAQPTPLAEPRAAVADINFVISELTKKHVPEEIINTWRGILAGTIEIPGKKQRDELMAYFPSRKDDKEANKKCKEIASKAFYPRSMLEERRAARQKAKADAAQRKAQAEAQFSGLVSIRALAENWKQESSVRIPLTPQLRLELAINALENIKEFMEQDPFIQANFNFASLAEWEKTQNKDTVMNFFARLITSPIFNDAMEYNAAQLLQHIETIREYPSAKGIRFLDKELDYEVIRALRNWIEHGNYLNDRDDYEPGKQESLLQNRQEVVGPIMIRLIFDLLPALKIMHVQLSPPPTPASYAAMPSTSPTLFKPEAPTVENKDTISSSYYNSNSP